MQVRILSNFTSRKLTRHIIGAGLVIYLLYHAFEGERGLYRWFMLKQEVRETNTLAAQIASEKNILQNRVTRLSPETLDLDLLEEQVRIILNFAATSEIVVINPSNP